MILFKVTCLILPDVNLHGLVYILKKNTKQLNFGEINSGSHNNSKLKVMHVDNINQNL